MSLSTLRVWLHAVTLVVPQPDYAAQLSAALWGQLHEGAVETKDITRGIEQLEVIVPQGAVLAAYTPSLFVSSYCGWGVKGQTYAFGRTFPFPLRPPARLAALGTGV